ncbi:MAG: LytTR family DNA-binding domain-containing protein [Bacteroidota bacterium]|nr:LytTR family DNA-binding domain-containing protein [Bacteroidota bacterium]
MKIKLTQFIYSFKDDLRLLLSISFSVFLFILFFQPFPLEKFDFNNRLLFVAGLAAIVFLFMVFVRFFVQWLKQKYEQSTPESGLSSFIGGFIILALCSVSFAFYMRYVGSVSISFFIMLKVVLICLAPPVALWQNDTFKELKEQNIRLLQEREIIPGKVDKQEDDYLTKSIEIISENSGEHLNLLISNIAFIKSADNYVEIVFKEGLVFRKKLMRNTLKNMEQQLSPYSNFTRCHRICIVNTHYIEELSRNYSNHWLTLKGFDERIPVSIQYVLKLKESL